LGLFCRLHNRIGEIVNVLYETTGKAGVLA
jgi:hypothetical protein